MTYLKTLSKKEYFPGLLLLGAAVIALLWANSSYQHSYLSFLNTPVSVKIGDFGLEKGLVLWINDALMALFFFLVGLELKKEILTGELRSLRRSALPIVGALGGMIVPAAVYFLFNKDTAYLSGWGVPMATDIAFAVGVLSLLGKKVPPQLKLFLLALAIVDDLGAILVIAFFYSGQLQTGYLLTALLPLAFMLYFNRTNKQNGYLYFFPALVLWFCILKSGIHATIAGVISAFLIPLTASGPKTHSHNDLFHRLEHTLQPWVNFFIMPLFALANAGVIIEGSIAASFGATITQGIFWGLFLGKQLGIFGFAYIAVKLKFAELPTGARFLQLYATAVIAGIGFTMSLFIADLAFPVASQLALAKVGVLSASLVSALFGVAVFQFAGKSK